MIKVNIFETKAKFSEYLDRASQGERVVIHRYSKPVAELRAIEPSRTEPRPVGPLEGRPTFNLPPSFFEPLDEEELQAWEGRTPASAYRAATPGAEARVAEDAASWDPAGPQAARRKPRKRT